RQKPPSVMVWVRVTSDGKKAPIIFVEEGVKIDQAVYLHLLSEEVVPWVQREYPTALLLFQQDGAPSHTSKLVQSFCTDMFADFWSKDLWPPSSPDLNPMDFGILSILETRVCSKSWPSVEILKKKLIQTWASLSEEEIPACVASTVRRLKAVVEAKEGY
ncbi:Putative DD37D maT transposase, partial [Caligus rogercresseyi]